VFEKFLVPAHQSGSVRQGRQPWHG